MGLDLNATGSKFIGGAGGGTNAGDPLIQTVQISQVNIGNVPVTEANLEAAVGTTGDVSWIGTGVASLVGILKSIALRLGVGVSVSDGSGLVNTGGVAQVLFGGLTPANGYMVQNNSASVFYISDVGTASINGTSFAVNPGILFSTPPNYKPPGPVSLYGGTSAQAYTARRW